MQPHVMEICSRGIIKISANHAAKKIKFAAQTKWYCMKEASKRPQKK